MAAVFKRILCPVDFDRNSMAALDLAATLAKQNDAALFAIHVVFVPASALGYPAEPYERLGQTQHADLAKLVQAHVPAGLPCETSVKVGNPAAEIVRMAEELKADLIVMATRGRTGLPRAVFGSVAEGVMRNSRCPVLAFKPESFSADRSSSGGADL